MSEITALPPVGNESNMVPELNEKTLTRFESDDGCPGKKVGNKRTISIRKIGLRTSVLWNY
jgi:hypothetical protein